MGRANLIAELLKGKPVKKFVYIDQGSDGPAIAGVKTGDICEFVCDIHGTEYRLKLSNGNTFQCSPTRLRELDDSPITAGDEMVAIHGIESQVLKPGVSYRVHSIESYGISVGPMNGGDWHCGAFSKSCFVKVKPLPQPEVKQEAAEPKPRFKYPMSTTTIGREFFMVKGLGPASYEHADYESALKEAERLAREHEGVPFTVMQSREVFCSGVVKFDPDFNRYTDTPF